jgi:YesN/AraC family two-component response regulator
MSDYVAKPIRMNELQAALERAGKWLQDRAKHATQALQI